MIIHIISRKKEALGGGQSEIVGNFNILSIFRKEEITQIVVVARTGKLYKNKNRSGVSPNGFFVMHFNNVFITF